MAQSNPIKAGTTNENPDLMASDELMELRKVTYRAMMEHFSTRPGSNKDGGIDWDKKAKELLDASDTNDEIRIARNLTRVNSDIFKEATEKLMRTPAPALKSHRDKFYI